MQNIFLNFTSINNYQQKEANVLVNDMSLSLFDNEMKTWGKWKYQNYVAEISILHKLK